MAAAAPAGERQMISERIAPGMLPRVLNSADMTIIFVAIVLFIVNASAIQRAGPAAYTYWILGFLAFLIPGALVTAQLGLMFPQEGSLYVWTQKAFGPFWGFFAGFCAWWPGILVMAATGDAVVSIWQFIETGGLPKNWAQRSEEHTSELQSRSDLVCRLLLEKKKKTTIQTQTVDLEKLT